MLRIDDAIFKKPGGRPKILVVEDEPDVAELVRAGMGLDGFEVMTAGSVAEMVSVTKEHAIDLFVLDVLLPDGSGIEIAKEIRRKSDVGIVFLTGQVEEIDMVLGLEVGGDDYISKPFRIREMRARIGSVYRRTQSSSFNLNGSDDATAAAMRTQEAPPQEVHQFFGWNLDTGSRSFRNDRGVELELTASEFGLLLVLARNRGRVLSRNQLLDALRGEDWASYDRLIDGLISRIRSKIAETGEQRTVIRTIRGVGYTMPAG